MAVDLQGIYNKPFKSFKKFYVNYIHLMTNTIFVSRDTFLMVYVGYTFVILPVYKQVTI
jgi:hypothetical protein